jgi:hypothetical protein
VKRVYRVHQALDSGEVVGKDCGGVDSGRFLFGFANGEQRFEGAGSSAK